VGRLDDIRKLQDRTKRFAVAVIRFYAELPQNEPARVICRQLLRSITSVTANYVLPRRARSGADFVSKISVVVEEMDEPLLWLELLVAASIVKAEAMQAFKNESDELLRFFSMSLMTAKANP
jgi:four helix bundle protein